MKLQLSEIMTATVSELDDADMMLAFEIEAIERQLSGFHGDDKVWRQKAIKARDHMQRTRNLVKQRSTNCTMEKSGCCTVPSLRN